MRKKFSIKLLTVLGVFVILLLAGKLLQIRQVNFKSVNAPCVDGVLKRRVTLLGKNILTATVNKQILSNYPCVGDIILNKTFPQKVNVTFVGRTPKLVANVVKMDDLSINEASPSSQSAVLENISDDDLNSLSGKGEKLLVDKDGVIFAQAGGDNLPVVNFLLETGIGSKLPDSAVEGILTVLGKLSELGIRVKNETVQGESLLVVADNPKRLYFNLESDIQRQLASLQLILRAGKMNSELSAKEDANLMEKIDLRFDKPVVIYSHSQ